MRGVKDAGLAEVAGLRRRVRRALAMGRIWPMDAEFLVRKLDEMEAYIVNMHETDGTGEEVD